MKTLLHGLMVLMFGALAGCVPWPHHPLTAPAISGTVMRAGKPAVGVRVQLVDMMTEAGDVAVKAKHQETVTDAQGHFSLGPLRRFSWHATVPLIGVSQHATPWALRMGTDTEAYTAGWVSDPTLFAEVPHVPLVAICELGAPGKSSVIKGDMALVGTGPCELAVSESKK